MTPGRPEVTVVPVCRTCSEEVDEGEVYCSNSCDWSENGPPDSFWESYPSKSESEGAYQRGQAAARSVK